MSEPEQSTSHDQADGGAVLSGLAERPRRPDAQTDAQPDAPPDTDASSDDDDVGSGAAPVRPSSPTQRGLPAVQPALASLLPPVAPQLHRARLSPAPERPPAQRPSSDESELEDAASGADDDDDRPTNVPPREEPEPFEASAAGEAGDDAGSSEPPQRAPIVPPPAEPGAAQAALEAEPESGPRTGSRPKPFPAPPGLPSFAQALWSAGLIAELRVESLANLPRLSEPPSPRERIDFLEAYYAAGSDPVVSLRRRATDRWFVFDASQPLAGPQLVQRLTFVLPELTHAHLERVGGKHGTLLLRAGEHVCALDDDQSERGNPTLAVSELVRGMNVLMERRGERVRLVGLVGDGVREAYVGLDSLTLALDLSGKELLTARDTETLMHLTGW